METTAQKKHVDVITKYFYPVAGGIENNVLRTYTFMQESLGWDVTIHTSADTYARKDSLAKEETIGNLKVKRYKTGVFGFEPDIRWDSTDVIALHNFDIFFIRYMLKALFLKLLGKKRFALMLTPHGGFNPEWSLFSPAEKIIKWIYTYTFGAWMANASIDGFRAVSEWEKVVASKNISPSLIRVISNGLEDDAYVDVDALASDKIKRIVGSFGPYIVQIGRIYAIKNFETAVSAMQHLPQDLKLVIIGEVQDQAYMDQLTRQIAELGLSDRVIFAGVIRDVDKYYVIRHAVAMVHMALWESFCNVVNEGLSQGIPCIVSNVYALPYLVRDGVNGFCLPVRDAKGVAEKVSWILDPKNKAEVDEIRAANMVFAKGKSWKDVAAGMDSFYRQCLARVRK